MIYAFLAASAIAFAPPASLFQAPPAVRFATPVMQLTRGGAPLLEEACTMGGGRVQGTLVRQSNGVIVPATTEASAPATAPTASTAEILPEACTMGGGRPSGTPAIGSYKTGSAVSLAQRL